ncbi:phosphoribosylanthranilate isomerase [Flavobacteriaceae bacterium]|nr:phosphoribosylanthranilate isomerase [Flavobacteriaceae bacterium]MDA7724356.1 phosphoribosylanthranilate isomerase [Flavobacteriaceae bacterium]MDA7727954.1 phosphoribosylanthranilate isomerase [Flavobacteriaceae bacterium]
MKLKVCGMRYEDNIQLIASIHPDYMGFIFFEGSSRHVSASTPTLPLTIKKVGVFVNASYDSIVEKINTHNLQAVQLHGEETAEFCKSLRALNVDIIKVFSIKNEFNFDVLTPYETVCDYYLFDTKGPLAGGNGYCFDWSVLELYPSTKPYFLSGGIGLENADQLQEFKTSVAATYCHAVDVNSKFEIAPAKKNKELLEKFKHLL